MQILAAPSPPSSSDGERVDLVLKPPRSRRLGDMFEVAGLLLRSGVELRVAKKAIDELAAGHTAYVTAPRVADYAFLRREMRKHKVTARRVALHPVDIKALRARLGISEEEFAGRYGVDPTTLRDWEQGRSKPEGAAATLIQLIERAPDKIVELLAS